MRLSSLLLALFRFLLLPALISTTYLYLYPVLRQCSFPPAKPDEHASYRDGTPVTFTEPAPFRLLALGDPQLEGDTSIPSAHDCGFWTLWEQSGWHGVTEKAKTAVKRYQKIVDLWGNDLYLAHIYRSMMWWSDPTHVVVLGDLLGSQWISDAEFARRSRRFWTVVFRGAEAVPRSLTDVKGRSPEVLGNDSSWRRRIIAVTGNHDIGYAGDIGHARVERFEKHFGRVNWDVRFRLNGTDEQHMRPHSNSNLDDSFSPSAPELRLIILNSMNLDEPVYDQDLREESWTFLRTHLDQPMPNTTSTVFLTHIPLYKKNSVCVDSEFFSYFPSDQGGGIKEQNFLSRTTSAEILDGLNGASGGQRAIILNGHDHAGCDTYHSRCRDARESPADAPSSGCSVDWAANRYHTLESRDLQKRTDTTGLREITVRSMMGDFDGNAGLLSGWWDAHDQEWKFEYKACMVGVQHIWWAVHVLDVIVAGLGLVGVVAQIVEGCAHSREKVKTL